MTSTASSPSLVTPSCRSPAADLQQAKAGGFLRPRHNSQLLMTPPLRGSMAFTAPTRAGSACLGCPSGQSVSDTVRVTVTQPIRVVRVAVPVSRKRRRWALRLVVGLFALGLLVPLGAAAFIATAARSDDRTPTDVIVVLGAAQFNGTPSPVLATRLEQARLLYTADVATRIITVGGKQPGDRTTEAQAGKAWLHDQGIQRSQVIALPEGNDTWQSMEAVAALMKSKGWTSATIVTDPVHETRTLAMARALGIDAHPSPTTNGPGSAITSDYVARETAGLLMFWLWQRWTH